MMRYIAYFSLFLVLFSSCRNFNEANRDTSCRHADYFDICPPDTDETGVRIAVISPYDGSCDTLELVEPLRRLVCMSSSHVACLSAAGAADAVCGVSGLRYLSDSLVRKNAKEIGYENNLDYETIMRLKPDLVLAYTVSGTMPQYVDKLRSLGVPVLVLYDHLESHPLARAEYIRLFGAMTGCMSQADSVYDEVCERYGSLARSACSENDRKKVLMNIPYGDAWYIPGSDGYMSRLVHDAGGEILGSQSGNASRVISMEEAFLLSQEADIWLNPGYCHTRVQLSEIHQLFPSFGPLKFSLPIYNNTLRMTPEGGNDFYESGVVRPDLILEDLIRIFDDSSSCDSLHYHLPLE